jgi:tRNA threonylcarbamoyl adenosine modification protein (Sua5/YciO/YrdC/YwlC family)
MARILEISAEYPQPRRMVEACAVLMGGGTVVYPTDSSYALGWRVGDRASQERAARFRKLGSRHNFTLVCRDLSEISNYALIDNRAYRLLRSLTPGPYTFILPATRDLPRRVLNAKRRTVGIRVPDHPVVTALLGELREPLLSTTLILAGEVLPVTDPVDAQTKLREVADLILDAGFCGREPSTIIDLSGPTPEVVRKGKGAVDFLD